MTDTLRQAIDLDESTLTRFRERAAADDASNTFFDSTHRDLVEMGHYTVNVAADRGGGGLDLLQTSQRQRLFARYAPAPALATCMHLYWTGAATDLARQGLDDLEFVTAGALAGEIFASGHAEPGNDLPVLLSTTVAEPVEGGYRVTGRKLFGSLGPVWSQMGIHAMDASDPSNPMIVHAFVRRDDAGAEVIENWDTIAMRASQSHDLGLDATYVPRERVGAVVPTGPDESPVTGAAFTWALTLISNVYLGIAERALEIAVASALEKTSIALDGRPLAHNPMLQHQVADMWMTLEGVRSGLDMLATDWVEGNVGPDWGLRLFTAKHRTSAETRRVVDSAMEVAGGSSIRSNTELSRLWRDSRAVAYHPPNDALAHEVVAKGVLGIDPVGPRW